MGAVLDFREATEARKNKIMAQILAIGEQQSLLFVEFPGNEAGLAIAASVRLLYQMAQIARDASGIDDAEWSRYVEALNAE